MPLGAATSQRSSGENICHLSAVRLRVNGIGNLDLSVSSLQDVKSKMCPNPISMAMVTDIEPHRSFNFMSQRMALKISTDAMGEYFRINRIVIFAREVFVAHPR